MTVTDVLTSAVKVYTNAQGYAVPPDPGHERVRLSVSRGEEER